MELAYSYGVVAVVSLSLLAWWLYWEWVDTMKPRWVSYWDWVRDR